MNSVCIVYSGDLGRPGGGTDRVSALAKGLHDSGYHVILVISKPSGPLPHRLENIQTETISLRARGVRNQLQRALLLVKRAKTIASSHSATLQVTHSPLAGIFALLNSEDYVLDMHDLAYSSPLYDDIPFSSVIKSILKKIERSGIDSASKIVVISKNMREFLINDWNVPENRIEVIPNGYFSHIQDRYYKTYSNRVPGRVVFLGMVHPKVNVEVINKLAELERVSELIVVGDGPKDGNLDNNKNPKLTFAGRVPDAVAFDIVSRAELAINPQSESTLQKVSSPVKLYLYAGLGLPMVATKGPEIVSELDKKDCLVSVSPRDTNTFISKTKELMENHKQRKIMATNAYSTSSEYMWENRSNDLVEMYDMMD
jgi:glycosyltransferase involved in cell wall biosynthesis